MSYKKKIEELQQLEKQLINKKQALLSERKNELFAIFEKTQTIDIDDELVIGALLIIQDAINTNTNQELLAKFRAKASDTFRKKPKKQQAA